MTKFEVWKRKTTKQAKLELLKHERNSDFLNRASQALKQDYAPSRQ